MLINPDSLVAQTIRHKYHKNAPLLEAKIGHIPFFLCKSLLSSIDLLKEGLVWRLDNGNSIKIWEHGWLPTPSSFSVQSPVTMLDRGAKVQELIDQSTGD